MRVLMVAYSGNSGIGYYSCQLCKELSNKGLDISLLTNRSYHLNKVSDNFTVIKYFSRTRSLLFELPFFLHYLARERFDILHFQSYIKYPEIDFLLWIYLSKKNKLVYTIHDILPHKPRFYDILLFKKIYAIFDALIAHSEGSKERVRKEFNVNTNKLFFIPHGVYDIYKIDNRLSKLEARNRLSLEKNKKIILFFGHINKRKGLENLINVFNELSEKTNTISLLIAGSGSSSENRYYMNMIRNSNSKRQIIAKLEYIPFHDVQTYFAASDFVVLPYTEGSTSGVIKLAYAFDKPVICTNIGDLSEMMKDGETGFVIPPSNERILKDRILRLINDDVTIKTFSNNIGKYKQQYNWDKIAQNTLDVYRSLQN